ncbi:MAG: hypothetical protein M1816_003549 [Peltula sp. TS41687]|nr:MAG: hypothetical protein M1816_003549 [Peltula sp. TS41687]
MSVRIQLDVPHSHFTNLDFISGRVFLNLSSDEAIASIVVKLEGESKTRLARPKSPYQEVQNSKKTEMEIHKILYKWVEVFPSEEIKKHTSSTAGYGLPAGQHSYPFRFKIPINNNCSNTNSLLSSLSFSGVRMEIARDTEKHVKKTLPPSLSGFPGEAEIRYYVKVTVARPRFYLENYRAVWYFNAIVVRADLGLLISPQQHSDFTFLPIEPPRPPDTKEETFARRQHQFPAIAPAHKKRGLFSAFRDPSPPPPISDPPLIGVDIRLPHPPIITCNEPLPLRVLVQRQSNSSEPIYLQSLQIELIAYTKVRAHELQRTETGSWVILTLSNMRARLDMPGATAGTETVLDDKHWKNRPLPNTVAPSFETCNISRWYEIEVRIGLAYGTPSTTRPEFILLPLRHPVKVFSGIAPPPALLAGMARRPTAASNPSNLSVDTTGLRPPPSQAATWHAETPVTPSYVSTPPRLGEHIPAGASSDLEADAAPPSYEDAMAEDVGPVDGHRRDYSTPVVLPEARRGDAPHQKEPSAGSRRDSERLFPDSEPGDAPPGSFSRT